MENVDRKIFRLPKNSILIMRNRNGTGKKGIHTKVPKYFGVVLHA